MSEPSPSPHEVTRLLLEWGGGNRAALDELMPLVYEELRRLARRYMTGERRGHTLQTTALVNEAYLRLVDQQGVRWQSRAHFFGIAARLMRQILVDHARGRQAAKRGGGAQVLLSVGALDRLGAREDVNLLELDEALGRLEKVDPQKTQIVELRYFGGLTIEETAEALSISPATVKRDWAMARAWLRRELGGG